MTDRRLSSFGADNSAVQYTSGHWSQIDAGASYLTRDPNATVTFTFDGTLITVAGTIQFQQPSQSPYPPLSYSLDGEEDQSFPFNVSSQTLYSSPELSQGPHTLAIRLLTNDNTTLSVSGGNITTPPPEPAAPTHHRTIVIVAGTLGGFVVLVVIFLALYLFNRRQRHYHASAPYALGPLQATLPSTKEAFTSSKYSNHGLSFSQSTDSVNVLPRVKAPPPPLPSPYDAPPKKPKSKSKPSATS